MQFYKTYKMVAFYFTTHKTCAIIALQNLIKATKTNPPRISPFCGPIADILLADTYIIAVRFKFVKIKFLITQKEGQKLDIKGA